MTLFYHHFTTASLPKNNAIAPDSSMTDPNHYNFVTKFSTSEEEVGTKVTILSPERALQLFSQGSINPTIKNDGRVDKNSTQSAMLPKSETKKELETGRQTLNSQTNAKDEEVQGEELETSQSVRQARGLYGDDFGYDGYDNFGDHGGFNSYGGYKGLGGYGNKGHGGFNYGGEQGTQQGYAKGYSKGYEHKYSHAYGNDYGQKYRKGHGYGQQQYGYGNGGYGHGGYGHGLYGFGGYRGYGHGLLGGIGGGLGGLYGGQLLGGLRGGFLGPYGGLGSYGGYRPLGYYPWYGYY